MNHAISKVQVDRPPARTAVRRRRDAHRAIRPSAGTFAASHPILSTAQPDRAAAPNSKWISANSLTLILSLALGALLYGFLVTLLEDIMPALIGTIAISLLILPLLLGGDQK